MLQTKPLHNRLRSLPRSFAVVLLSLLAVSSTLWAQPGTLYISNTSASVKSFSDGSLWPDGDVPPDSSNVQLFNALVTLDSDKVFGTLELNGGSNIAFNGYTITILDQLLNNNGPTAIDAGTSTVILKSTVADGGSGQVTVGGSANVTLYKVEVAAGSVVDFDAGGSGNTETFITHELKMGGGSVVVNPPNYGGASTLLYEAAYSSVGTEWTAGATSGKGVPHHVSIGGSGSLSFADTTGNFTCTGDFTMLDASGSLNLSNMVGNLTVDGNFTTGTNGAVTVTMPSVEGKGTLTVGGNMSLNSNTTWTGDEGNVAIGGNLANNISGTAFGLLKFDGALDQDITGNKITVDSLVVANTQNATTDDTDVDFQADVDIVPGGVFNPVDGTTKVTGTFTMNSDANGTARIATLADAGATSDVHGDITFERYVPGRNEVCYIAAGNYVVGATLGDWSTSFGADNYWVLKWDETHILNNSASSNGASWWSWLLSGDATVLEDSDYGYYILTMPNSSPTLTASGGYNTSQVDLSLTFTNGAYENGGWHLLTNPFPSPIDGTEFLNDNSGIVSAYQMYNNETDVFAISGSGAPGTIDVGQSFWVQVGAAGTLSFQVDQITSGENSFVREYDPLEQAFFGIHIDDNGRYGETFIRLHESATNEYEWEHDITLKHSGSSLNPEIYSKLSNGHELVVNAPGALGDVEEISLVVETGQTGLVTIGAVEDFPLPAGLCALITDTETGDVAGLGGDPLVVQLEPNSTYENRFVLSFSNTPLFEASASHCEGGIVHFIGEDAPIWEIEWSDASGELNGSGCVTGLLPGEFIFEATNPLNMCHTETTLSIPEVCMGDFNLNGERDITDLLILLVSIQPVENFEGTFPEADCDCDGVMTTLDLLTFLPTFGAMCE